MCIIRNCIITTTTYSCHYEWRYRQFDCAKTVSQTSVASFDSNLTLIIICLCYNSPRQSNFLRRVGSQIRIIKLQSFLFFGTVVKVEATIRDLLDAANWEANPIRFLILDFSLASGVDFSAAEAFLRIQRLLEVREVVLVLCGCDPETPVGKSLRNIELFRDSPEERVRVFSNLNDALEVSSKLCLSFYKLLTSGSSFTLSALRE